MTPHLPLVEAYDGITQVVARLDDSDLQRPTRCHGWLVVDLLLHLVGDAQRAVAALDSPTDGPSDVDAVTYWKAFAAENDPAAASAWAVRRAAAGFDRPTDVVQLWADTALAAVRAAEAADPDSRVTTQGHVLTVADLLTTLATEAAIHHLDLVVDLPRSPLPGPLETRAATATLDGLLGDMTLRPESWDDHEYLLKATGRLPLTGRDRLVLGDAVRALPLLR
ncbi:maleylpyruvate isomerase N-terminal domain-containing protein [Mumia quercus]|uniref:maleylpyruvate isomerase N-terminal domain-containing protein n=1 Tax=Mumia quercus TaxID=2976125 RepID=UPI0021D2EDF9|nr:maleylpyruvate isomerase N-terminal domain-containing protein [Mumia quercus]